jgi:hypothetical protein
MASRIRFLALLGSFTLSGLATPAVADQVSREQDIVNLRLGQRILVDEEVSGAQMTANGVVRVRKCISRQGARR